MAYLENTFASKINRNTTNEFQEGLNNHSKVQAVWHLTKLWQQKSPPQLWTNDTVFYYSTGNNFI